MILRRKSRKIQQRKNEWTAGALRDLFVDMSQEKSIKRLRMRTSITNRQSHWPLVGIQSTDAESTQLFYPIPSFLS